MCSVSLVKDNYKDNFIETIKENLKVPLKALSDIVESR